MLTPMTMNGRHKASNTKKSITQSEYSAHYNRKARYHA